MCLRFRPIQFVFFYRIHNLSLSLFSDAILPKLKHALSLTLQHYPHLAGNLTWHPHTGTPVFRITSDDGVFLTVAESTVDFDSLSTDNAKEVEQLHALVSENQATVVSLQVTLFPGYGFSISYNIHHAALDGKSAALFFKSWAKICQVGVLPPELTPVLERSLIDDPLDICKIFTDMWTKIPPENSFSPLDQKKRPPNLYRGMFRLSREHISDIKGRIKIMSPVSSFTAVCSYIWTCLVRAEAGDITDENVFLGINAECRSRLEPPIPGNYVGNCLTFRVAAAKVVECLEGGDGLATAATAIKEAIGSLPKGVVKGAEKWFSDDAVKALKGKKVYGIGGSPMFGLYGADFGWGRPTKVEMVSIDKGGAFSLTDDRDGTNGMEIGIVLTKPKIEAFKSIFAGGLEEIDNK